MLKGPHWNQTTGRGKKEKDDTSCNTQRWRFNLCRSCTRAELIPECSQDALANHSMESFYRERRTLEERDSGSGRKSCMHYLEN